MATVQTSERPKSDSQKPRLQPAPSEESLYLDQVVPFARQQGLSKLLRIRDAQGNVIWEAPKE